MMKKIIVVAVAASMLLAGVVSAASVWGTYKGNDIVRITSNGVALKTSDVPAISYNGRTMIPINLLSQLGLTYNFNQSKKTVDINSTNVPISSNYSIEDLVKSYGKKGLNLITMAEYSTDGNGFSQISLTTNFDYIDSTKNNEYNALLAASNKVGAAQIRFFNSNSKYILFIKTTNYQKFLNGTISDQEFNNTIEFVSNSSNIPQPAPTNSPNTTPITKTTPLLYSNNLKVYLGKLTTNEFDKDSIFNEFGTYGSKFQSKSIFNEFGTYGSEFSNESAFNKFASKPPAIVSNGKIIGYLTINTFISGAISPAGLKEWLKQQGF